MDDSRAMRLDERVGNLGRTAQDLVERERSASETGGQGLAAHELHDQKVHAVVLTDVIQRANVRMAEAGDHSRFALESLAQLDPMQNLLREHLHRNGPVEPNIPGPIDLAHASRAERGLNLVRAKTGTRADGHTKA